MIVPHGEGRSLHGDASAAGIGDACRGDDRTRRAQRGRLPREGRHLLCAQEEGAVLHRRTQRPLCRHGKAKAAHIADGKPPRLRHGVVVDNGAAKARRRPHRFGHIEGKGGGDGADMGIIKSVDGTVKGDVRPQFPRCRHAVGQFSAPCKRHIPAVDHLRVTLGEDGHGNLFLQPRHSGGERGHILPRRTA